MRIAGLATLIFAACSGGGGEAPLTLRVDNLSGLVTAGEPMAIAVVLLRGNQVATDYRGDITFRASVDGTLPQPFTMTAADAGTRTFSGEIMFPDAGPCTLTISADGASDVSIALEVALKPLPQPQPGSTGPFVPTPKVGALVPIEPALDGVKVIAVAIGDCDGDGVLDIFVGTAAGEKNLVFLNKGNATFGDSIETSEDAMGSLIAADFNGDGFADLAYIDQGNQVLVRMNDGAGSFGAAKLLAFGAHALATGDIDGDGSIDIVAGGTHAMSCLNDGSGNFRSGGQRWLSNWPIHALALADFDADGDLDVATMGGVLLNDGSGKFETSNLGFPDCIAVTDTSIRAADLDGDGDMDLVVGVAPAPPNDAPIQILINVGNGFESNGQSLGTGVFSSLLLLDVDFDGDLDLLSGASDYGTALWINDGAGQFERSFSFPPPKDMRTVDTGDLDGDGDRDVVIGEHHGLVHPYRHTMVPRPK